MITTTDVHEFMEKLAQRQRPVDPNNDPRLLPDYEPPIKGRPTGPKGGCTINGNYYNPCPKNPAKPGL